MHVIAEKGKTEAQRKNFANASDKTTTGPTAVKQPFFFLQ